MREETITPRSSGTERKSDPAAWILAALSCIALAGLFAAGKGTLLRMGIPAAATCVGLSLYVRKPTTFVEFTLWTWLLTPFVRRAVDWRVGFADHNLVLLTPFLVSFICILDLRDFALLHRVRMAPFMLCATGIMYGFFVGMAIHPSGEVIYGLVSWLSPMLLGLHLYLHWEEHDAHTAVIQRVAIFGLLLIGIYGIYQFYKPPVWDKIWLENLPGGLESSTFGRPEPKEIRVWSTLNAPGPFANVAVALLFLAVPARSRLKLPAVAAGLYALLLSLVRTAWLTGVVGMLVMARNSNKKLFLKIVVAMGLCGIALALLANSSLEIPIIQDRLKTLGDLKNDESVQDRKRLYTDLSKELLTLPVGIGLTNADFYKGYPLDSGPIRMVLNLGWFGTLIFSLGVGRIIFLLHSRKSKNDSTAIVCHTIVVTFILQLLSGLIFISSSGAMFWIAAGLGLASTVHNAEEFSANRRQALAPGVINPRFTNTPAAARPRALSSLEEIR